MEQWILVALASVAAAVAFFAAGMLLRPPAPRARPTHAPDLDGAATRTVLQRLVDITGGRAAALYDGHGLLVDSVGAPPPDSVGALAGSLLSSLQAAQAQHLATGLAAVQLHDATGGPLRLRCISSRGEVFVVATFGEPSPDTPHVEDALALAIPRLLTA